MTDPIVNNAHKRTRTPIRFEGHGRTKQAFRDECDINQILLRWNATGQMPNINLAQPRYGDFTTSADYMDACNAVIDAEHAFSKLPARTRARMGHSPAKLLDFLADPDNHDEAIALGLLPPDPKPPAPESLTKPVPNPQPEPSPTPSPIAGGE